MGIFETRDAKIESLDSKEIADLQSMLDKKSDFVEHHG